MNLTDDLLAFLDACPSPYHAVAAAREQLERTEFVRLDEGAPWKPQPEGRYVVERDGTLIAIQLGTANPAEQGFALIGAHTDSPNLRVKPHPQRDSCGYQLLNVEPYGGVLFHTWLDRDLSLAGRVVLRSADGIRSQLLHIREPLLRVPSLAIHLNRRVNEEGLQLNAQEHLSPLLGAQLPAVAQFKDWLNDWLPDARNAELLSWDLSLYDTEGARCIGSHGSLLSSARLDNLLSCFVALRALRNHEQSTPWSVGIALYDHEEVGSQSASGAKSHLLENTLLRLCGNNAENFQRAMSKSFLVSSDMAHALHPNYVAKHDPQHRPMLGGGPVLKTNHEQAYATEPLGAAHLRLLARDANVTLQDFVARSDMRCGSTIGPIVSSTLGVRTVDVGNPMLSMHSCRELAATDDVPQLLALFQQFFQRGPSV